VFWGGGGTFWCCLPVVHCTFPTVKHRRLLGQNDSSPSSQPVNHHCLRCPSRPPPPTHTHTTHTQDQERSKSRTSTQGGGEAAGGGGGEGGGGGGGESGPPSRPVSVTASSAGADFVRDKMRRSRGHGCEVGQALVLVKPQVRGGGGG
jgi:hypothetical protein